MTVIGCQGGSSPAGAPNGGTITSNLGTTISISIPNAQTQSRARKPASLAPAAQSISIIIDATTNGQQVYDSTTNLTAGSPGCTQTESTMTCTIQLTLQAGSYLADIATYGGENGQGGVLSEGQQYPFGIENGVAKQITFTLSGVPSSIAIAAVTGPPSLTSIQGDQSSGYDLYASSSQSFAVTAYEASGAAIVGAGAPSLTAMSSNGNFNVTEPTTDAPNTVIVTPPTSNTPSTTQLNVQASFADPTICTQPNAVCSGKATVNFLNIAGDDWPTYAHDFMRTGDEVQSTGISTSTVSSLALRWQAHLPDNAGVYASPVVYDGNVILVTYSPPAVVYDLSAVNGSVLWAREISGGAIQTPTIDPAAGLVFVGNRLATGTTNLPSTESALSLKDGSVVWSTTVDGLTRSTPVVTNGSVYVGTAGGDPPQCLNGGVEALNELTGATEWVWNVNATTSPNGGGSVWGAIAFDGSRLIFGTGNTCQTPVMTANGAAALDLNGNLLWSIVAQPNSSLDYDTGSSVVVSNGNASFFNKNGILYTVDAATGHLMQQTTVDSNYGYGEFPSPASDGVTTVIGGGLYPTPSPDLGVAAAGKRSAPQVCMLSNQARRAHPFQIISGYTSNITGINASGTIIWQHSTTSMLVGYPAIDNGVVFTDLDSSLGALNITTGNELWSYALASLPEASPVVVPSGVYIADGSGNVYAFSLPYSTGSTPSSAARRPQYAGHRPGATPVP